MKKVTLFVGAALLVATGAYAGDTAETAKSMTATTAAFESLDKNSDQQISKTEAASDQTLSDSFAAADANGDGYLNKSEFVARTKT
jgi:Ca2+-binding EF-hand superfamily protein